MERQLLYKKTSETVDKLRTRKREEHDNLRKEKRDRILSLKRLKYEESCADSDYVNLTVEEVTLLAASLRSHRPDSLAILKKLKRGFTQGDLIADTFMAQDGALESLVRFLTGNDVDLQTEAAWCLTNLAGSVQDHAIRIQKAVGAYLVTYLRSSNVLLQELCAWTLGNLAGDCDDCRRIMLDQGAIDYLVYLLNSTFLSVVQSAAFAICNLAHGKDRRTFEAFKKSGIGAVLFRLLKSTSTSVDVITELVWILTHFSATSEDVEYIFFCGISVSFMVELLARCAELPDSVQALTAIIRSLGNTCSGPDEVGEEALKSGFLLKAMTSLLNSSIHHLRKESLWLLCNLTAGSIDSVKAVLETGLLPVVVEMLDGPFDVRKESARVLLHIGFLGEECLREIANLGTLGKFLELLKTPDKELCLLGLQFFEMMFRTFPESRGMFDKADGITYLDALQFNEDELICNCVNDLIRTYFENEIK